MSHPHSLNLKNRILWFDGSTSVGTEIIIQRLLDQKSINGLFVHELDSDVKKFNSMADDKIKIKFDANVPPAQFNIPEKYKNLKLRNYLLNKLKYVLDRDKIEDDEQIEARISRLYKECELFEQYGIIDLIKTTIYIVDTFEDNNVVWGTGRGSSCACYCLYLIGLHEVDSVLYNLDLHEFFR